MPDSVSNCDQSRVEITEDMIHRAAIVRAGSAPCWCPDDWRADTPEVRKRCPQHGDRDWPAPGDAFHRHAREILEAALNG
jgi:hypothetical protein